MRLIEFEGHNRKIAEHQEEYETMPAYVHPEDPTGKTIVCWKLTWRERLKILFTGEIWHMMLTFQQKMQPQLLSSDRLVMKRKDA